MSWFPVITNATFKCSNVWQVRVQLSLAIAALSSHLPAAQWGEGGVVAWLGQHLTGPAAMACMLEMLTVLPQVSPLVYYTMPTCSKLPKVNTISLVVLTHDLKQSTMHRVILAARGACRHNRFELDYIFQSQTC